VSAGPGPGRALALAFDQLGDPRIRRVLWLGIASALFALIALAAGATVLLANVRLAGGGWLDTAVDVAGGLAAVALAIVLFPSVVGLIAGFLLEDVARAVEGRHYPGLPPPRPQGVGEAVWTAARFFVLLAVLNLLALVFVYWIPVVNIPVFVLLNGFLIGREYFEMAALRRLPPAAARRVRGEHGGRVFIAGVALAVLLAIPLVNLLVPVLATATMVHVFQGIARERADMIRT
jgi:uncharacterized protein involved in cysteine biosynthesis